MVIYVVEKGTQTFRINSDYSQCKYVCALQDHSGGAESAVYLDC